MPTMADEIVEVVRDLKGSVTHGTLINHLGDRVRGDIGVYMDTTNIYLFVGASQEFADAVNQLRSENPQRVVIRPIEYLCLFIDGCPMPTKMPFVKKIPKGGRYKNPHFAPVCFDIPRDKK